MHRDLKFMIFGAALGFVIGVRAQYNIHRGAVDKINKEIGNANDRLLLAGQAIDHTISLFNAGETGQAIEYWNEQAEFIMITGRL